MPNEHGQITEDDFKALPGQFRVMGEFMSDADGGDLRIMADIEGDKAPDFARNLLRTLREEHEDDVFTLCDQNGPMDI